MDQDQIDEIFENVMTALQPAEELGGPLDALYVSLMERVAHEAQRRANRVRQDFRAHTQDDAPPPRKLWNVAYRKVPTAYHSTHSVLVRARTAEEAHQLTLLTVAESIIVDAVTEVSLDV